MNICLCNTVKQKYNAAKAHRDARQIAMELGFRKVVLFHNGYPKPYILCELVWACMRTTWLARKNDTVFIQYPYYPSWVERLFLTLLHVGKKIKGYKVTMLIHDVISLRQQVTHPDRNLKSVSAEIQAWSWVDCAICHNESMLSILKKAHSFDKYAVLGVFDYLYEGPVCKRGYSERPTVMIAGNLSHNKCGYVYKLGGIDNAIFELFGPNYSGENKRNVHYRGLFSSVDLIPHLDGQFGLVWDGDSIDTCDGDYGNYLKYNNPYKFSLYLAAGVPVIVWKESALAEFVKKTRTGICVGSLHELSICLFRISKQEYDDMIENITKIRRDIIAGNNLRKILSSY